jgi:hypothetical protein
MYLEMFSHIINNPNNFIIKDDYYIVPFGHSCSSALACKYANIRKFSLPFDWTVPLFPKKIQKVLENNFHDFIPDVYNPPDRDSHSIINGVFPTKYNFSLAHFNSNINAGVEEYKRRIDRFNNIINKSKKIYFIYINEDYLFDNNYRQVKFNDNIFNEMLELETFLKDKYIHIDYNIIYFNFKQHIIPINSNIINIVLNTPTVYDTPGSSPYSELRNYCGKILSELFNTNLSLVYDSEIFNN